MIDQNSFIEIYNVQNRGLCYMADEMMRRTRSRDVPQIFVDGEFIGGCHELKGLLG